jgi:ATP-dependent Clp protease ATP-binding subunit ClpA
MTLIFTNNTYSENLHSQFNDDNEGFDFDNEEKGPALELYGTDLTLLASLGQLEECFGREQELLEMMEILVRRQKNNPVLVGDAGVGKTAIVELFANKIVNNLVPFVLEGRSIVSLDLARIVAGSRYRGEFELRFQRVLDEVLAQPHIIIFIDEIHNIGGTGSAEGSLDAANILKPVLSRSGFQCIGATTTKEYQKIEKDPALNRRFQPIKVKEPSIEDTVKILYGLRPSLEAFHNVEITPAAIKLAVDLASRYIYDRFLPDKAIDLVDRAAAKEVIKLTNVTERSVLSSLVNASLNNIGSLRLEAFRRGDIGSEFVFQEIENAYRSFLLRWIESPLKVPEESKPILSPIAQSLFDQMRVSILTRVDELLFSSSKPRQITKRVKKSIVILHRVSRKVSYQI